MDYPAMVTGDLLGLPFPPTIERLLEQGPDFLTRAFRRSGALGEDNAVVRIVRSQEFFGGGMGRKLLLGVEYQRQESGLHTELFVKFPRDFGDPLRELFGPLMAPEVRFALLSRREGFPIAVPRCYFADYHAGSTSGILITERVAYGSEGIEAAFEKCLDHELADPLPHYRALTLAMARLAAAHKAGRLGKGVDSEFPFEPGQVDVGARIPYTPAQLTEKLAVLQRFAAAHPQLFPPTLDAAFLARFAVEAPQVLEEEMAIRAYLNGQPDYIALCHWNMNLDNAWFWREGGELAAGLLDWGSVAQMNLAQGFYGMSCAAEADFLQTHRSGLIRLFIDEYAAGGGPRLDEAEFGFMYRLAVAVLGIAWILDAPTLVSQQLGDTRQLGGRDDPALRGNFLARCQLQLLIVFLSEWRACDIGGALRDFRRMASPPRRAAAG